MTEAQAVALASSLAENGYISQISEELGQWRVEVLPPQEPSTLLVYDNWTGIINTDISGIWRA